MIERREEDSLFRCTCLQRRPCLRHTPFSHIVQQSSDTAEGVVHLLPAYDLNLDDVAVSNHRRAYLLNLLKWHTAMKRILKITVAHRAALLQDGPHLDNGIGMVMGHAANASAEQHDVMAASDELEWVELQVFHRPYGLL